MAIASSLKIGEIGGAGGGDGDGGGGDGLDGGWDGGEGGCGDGTRSVLTSTSARFRIRPGPGSCSLTYCASCGHSLRSGPIASAAAVSSAQTVHASVARTR